MGYRDDIIDIARTQLGYTEGPNNDTIYGDWYGLPNQPWCAMFVSWCADQAGISQDIIKKFASCTTGFRWFDSIGESTRDHITPNKGDIIFFIWTYGEATPDHVGLVEKVENGKVYTIEGNRNDRVGRYSYDLNDWRIYGYSLPDYGDSPEPTPPTPSGDGQIRAIQEWVNSYGFNIAVDGEFGPETAWGITCVYQIELNTQFGYNLDIDGIFGEDTYAHTPVVGYGAQGAITMAIQSMLYCKGYDTDGVDGLYYSGTKRAITQFQIDCGFTGKDVDGVYGPDTGIRLFN